MSKETIERLKQAVAYFENGGHDMNDITTITGKQAKECLQALELSSMAKSILQNADVLKAYTHEIEQQLEDCKKRERDLLNAAKEVSKTHGTTIWWQPLREPIKRSQQALKDNQCQDQQS